MFSSCSSDDVSCVQVARPNLTPKYCQEENYTQLQFECRKIMQVRNRVSEVLNADHFLILFKTISKEKLRLFGHYSTSNKHAAHIVSQNIKVTRIICACRVDHEVY